MRNDEVTKKRCAYFVRWLFKTKVYRMLYFLVFFRTAKGEGREQERK